jgi:nucleoside-diphosphate-sugar epimerase
VVDLGMGELHTAREAVEKIVTLLSAHVRPEFGALADRPLERARRANPAETEAILGWQPRIGLEEGLGRTIAWYRERFAAGVFR